MMRWFLIGVATLLGLVLFGVLYLGSLKKEIAALRELMSDGQWHYGLDLVKASGGRLKRGSIYVILGRLVLAGVVETRTTKFDGLYKWKQFRIKSLAKEPEARTPDDLH